ncbi:MAG: cytochrome P450 [Flavobacteriaceae bacterium]
MPGKSESDLPVISRWDVLRNRQQIFKNPLPFHRENFQKFGDSFRVKVGMPNGVIFTRNPKIIRHILQKNHRKYQKSKLQTVDLAKYIGRGLLTSNGEHWRVHRRMIQPAFHKKNLAGLFKIMDLAIQEELRRINVNVKEEADVFPLMGDLAFQVVAKSLFSRSDIREPMKRLQEITQRNQRMLIREMRQPYLNWWFKLSGMISKHLKQSEQARNILNKIIEERIISGGDKNDLLDMLLEARYEDGTPMPRRQLIDEVMILFTAGHETTANALSFTLYFLAKDKQVQEKVYGEVADLDLQQDSFTDQFKKLSYTQCCIEESLRLYPPAYIIDREAVEDDEIDDLFLAKDSLVLMSVFELHRYREFWIDPEQYRPERFLEILPKEYANYYYPFGAGPRMCIGNNFAMYEMLLTIARIVSKYKIDTPLSEIEINPMITLKPRKMPIRFSLREKG